MIAYVIAGVVAVAFLYAAYRAFGGAASRPVDPLVLLRAALAGAGAAAGGVATMLAAGVPRTAAPGRAPTYELARSLRRLLDGCGHQLQQVDTGALDDDAAAAHQLLQTAVTELSWVVRIVQSDDAVGAAGMRRAVAELRGDADRCVATARDLLAPSAVPEEGHGAGQAVVE